MKKTNLKTLFSGIAIAGALMAIPVSTFAANASSTATVRINGDGIVHVINAEVTSISGNIINAVTRFKNSVVNWAFTTNTSTTIAANNSLTGTTTDIHVGDRLKVNGLVSAFGSTISVQANAIKDITSMASWRVKSGTIQSITTANGTFVLKQDDKLVTVQTNASTTFILGNKIGSQTASTTPMTFALLAVNSKVMVSGIMSADGTSMTATKVIVKETNDNKSKHEWKKEWKDAWKSNRESTRESMKEDNEKGDKDQSHDRQSFLKSNLGISFGNR